MKRRTRQMMRAAVVVALGTSALAALAAGCTEPANEEKGAAAALENATGVAWIVQEDPKTGAIRFAAPKNGPFDPKAGAPGEESTMAFLAAQKAIFKMYDPRGELVLDRTTRPSDGTTHVRFRQQVGTIPVSGGTWTAHFDAMGRLASMSGNYVVDAHAIATTPAITAETAAGAAKDEAARRKPSASALQTSTPTLEILPVTGGAPVLSWAVTVSGRSVALDVSVDATSGAVRQVEDGILDRTATAPAPQTYPPYGADASPLTFPISDDDPPRLSSIGPGPVRQQVSIWSAGGPDAGPIMATSLEPWVDGVSPPGAAAAAQAHSRIVLDYYAEHRWGAEDAPYFGVDGTGRLPVRVFVNANDEGPNNAYWDRDTRTLSFGDGDPQQDLWPTSASLDTVAHELTHGVTMFTSGLRSVDGADSRALGESMSDVFAALITHRIRNDDRVDFTFSEDDNGDGQPIRSMIQPNLLLLREPGYSDMFAVDAGDGRAHHNSNVPSHAFYLLTHGGVHLLTRWNIPCGIGWAAADRLYWRLQTSHVQPSETFKDFALHSLAAARELGITEAPIACAWVAVGVLTQDEARNDWNVTCERAGSLKEAGADAGDNFLVVTPTPLVECSVSLTGGGVSLGSP